MDEASGAVIHEIISWCSTSSLKALCLSSKKLNRLATPQLYSTLVLEQRGPRGGVIADPFAYLLPITYLIFSSPAHASWVTSLVVIGDLGRNYETETGAPDRFGERKRLWPHHGTPVLEDILWKKCTEYALNDSEGPRMKLDLYYGFTEHPELVQMLGRVGNRVFPFEHTHTMSHGPFAMPIDILIKSRHSQELQSPQDLAPFLNLPRLRCLYGLRMEDSEEEPRINMHELASLKPCSCPVEHIELRRSVILSRNLENLVKVTIPGKLKSFTYEIGESSWSSCSINHETILSSLDPHLETLEAPALTHADLYHYQYGSDGHNPCAISLAPFTALRRLKIAPVYIWSNSIFTDKKAVQSPRAQERLWQALPASLEQLWITRAQGQKPMIECGGPYDQLPFVPLCLLPALKVLIQRKPDRFPGLVDLRIEFPPSAWEPEWYADLASVCGVAEAARIRCTIILAEGKILDRKTDVERGWGWDEDVQWEPCFLNQEYAKTWIRVAEEKNLVERMRVYREEILRLWGMKPSQGVRALLEMGRYG
ncbi:hypothetical protein FB567DRAFT_611306 [Paraphoma chrysanthemicola]|uniref:Uncharacterized protein n=1 Tax=Paraphoma chrysanthemicola TaxID=798071 RepID=A0A8K0QVF8_9PLEO|nr:hypothetical protein FB567DRAFT_611306 [Paraphoma chrysanthemicola]